MKLEEGTLNEEVRFSVYHDFFRPELGQWRQQRSALQDPLREANLFR